MGEVIVVIVVIPAAEFCLIALTWIHGHCGNSTTIAGKLELRYSGLARVDVFTALELPS